MNDTLFWEKLAGEPDMAYNAFCVYRDMGLTRTLRKAAKAFYSQREDYQGATEELPTISQVQRFKQWSAAWLWRARVEAFDAEEARERSLRMRERRIKLAEQHFAVGSLAMNRAAERLRNLGMDEEIPLKSLPPLIRAAADLQRLALGEVTASVDLRGTARPSEEDDDAAWLDGLSVEDQEELARIAGLLEEEDYLPDGETWDDDEAL